jgi:hypothetical protein
MVKTLFGRDNLAAFYAAQVRAREGGVATRIHIVGDSKVAGVGVQNGYRLDQLLPLTANGNPVEVTYSGFSGENSYLWAGGAAALLAAYPDIDLLIVNFGTNEHVATSQGGSQARYQTVGNHRAAISALRAVRSISAMSILLLGQTPCNNWQPGFDQTTDFMVCVNAALLEVARTCNCAYFDTTELYQRPHAEAGWMEQVAVPQYGGGNVHPAAPFNLSLVGELGRRLFPLPYSSQSSAGDSIYTLAPQNGWTGWGGPNGFVPRARIKSGLVHLQGVFAPGARDAGTVLATLPTDCRPACNKFFVGTTSNTGTIAELQLLSTGELRLGGQHSGSYVSLDSISYLL